MDKNDLVELLNNLVAIDDIVALAKENDLVIISGWANDVIFIEGAIADEIEWYSEQDIIPLLNGSVLYNSCHDGCPHFKRLMSKAAVIKPKLENGNWSFETDIPHEKFCRLDFDYGGIVFNLNDIPTWEYTNDR